MIFTTYMKFCFCSFMYLQRMHFSIFFSILRLRCLILWLCISRLVFLVQDDKIPVLIGRHQYYIDTNMIQDSVICFNTLSLSVDFYIVSFTVQRTFISQMKNQQLYFSDRMITRVNSFVLICLQIEHQILQKYHTINTSQDLLQYNHQ